MLEIAESLNKIQEEEAEVDLGQDQDQGQILQAPEEDHQEMEIAKMGERVHQGQTEIHLIQEVGTIGRKMVRKSLKEDHILLKAKIHQKVVQNLGKDQIETAFLLKKGVIKIQKKLEKMVISQERPGEMIQNPSQRKQVGAPAERSQIESPGLQQVRQSN